MTERFEQPQELSPAGERRRDAILVDAVRLGRQRRRNRQVARAATVVMPMLAVLILVALHTGKQSAVTKVVPPVIAPRVVAPTAPTTHRSKDDVLITSNSAVRIERIIDDPAIVARYATSDSPLTITRIDDQQLFKELANANLRGGLATMNGQTRLVLTP